MNAAIENMQSDIEARIRKAETGEQWAEICLMESRMVDAIAKTAGVPAQYGCEECGSLVPVGVTCPHGLHG